MKSDKVEIETISKAPTYGSISRETYNDIVKKRGMAADIIFYMAKKYLTTEAKHLENKIFIEPFLYSKFVASGGRKWKPKTEFRDGIGKQIWIIAATVAGKSCGHSWLYICHFRNIQAAKADKVIEVSICALDSISNQQHWSGDQENIDYLIQFIAMALNIEQDKSKYEFQDITIHKQEDQVSCALFSAANAERFLESLATIPQSDFSAFNLFNHVTKNPQINWVTQQDIEKYRDEIIKQHSPEMVKQ